VRIIQVDFNGQDEDGRISLTFPSSLRDIAGLSPPLREGDRVLLTDGEGFAYAAVTSEGGVWIADVDWDSWMEPALEDCRVELGRSHPVRERAA